MQGMLPPTLLGRWEVFLNDLIETGYAPGGGARSSVHPHPCWVPCQPPTAIWSHPCEILLAFRISSSAKPLACLPPTPKGE